ncbi:MAG: AMP-binding protein [Mycolicibacterium insubricum]
MVDEDNEDNRFVPVGTSGRIVVHGPLDYDGYTHDQTATIATKGIVDGHVDTGDLGHFDHDGLLFIDGRSDDMVVSGGENIFPREVEDALTADPEISDAVVLGVDDDEYGQVLNAYLVSDRELTVDELKSHLRKHLEPYKVPKVFARIDSIPRNAAGKVLRGELPGRS